MENIAANLQGLAIGLATFLIIGLFHPLVIKGEYYFGTKISWAFGIAGAMFLGVAFICTTIFWSAVCGILAFSCFWSILEVMHQKKRVEKGWFPMNPKRKRAYKRGELIEE